MDLGHWILFTGHCILGNGQSTLNTGHYTQGTGQKHWTLPTAMDTGYWTLAIGHWTMGTGHWALHTGHCTLDGDFARDAPQSLNMAKASRLRHGRCPTSTHPGSPLPDSNRPQMPSKFLKLSNKFLQISRNQRIFGSTCPNTAPTWLENPPTSVPKRLNCSPNNTKRLIRD